VNLVVQSTSLDKRHVDELRAMTGAATAQRLGEHAYRLKAGAVQEAVAPWCEARRIDHAWMPEGRRFDELKLVAMDMDSTLITIECIDELGAAAGKGEAIAGITAQAMRGEIDYPESLKRRVRMLEDLDEKILEDVYREKLRLTPGAEELVAACKSYGIKLLLVSGGFTFYTGRLKERLGIDYTLSNTLEVRSGKLTGRVVGDIVDAEAKAARFRSVMAELGARKEQTVAIGDGANDLKMMAEAGTSVAFRAKPVVRAQASCALSWSGLDGVLKLFE
jgi:phosphoserine phosphatase